MRLEDNTAIASKSATALDRRYRSEGVVKRRQSNMIVSLLWGRDLNPLEVNP